MQGYKSNRDYRRAVQLPSIILNMRWVWLVSKNVKSNEALCFYYELEAARSPNMGYRIIFSLL